MCDNLVSGQIYDDLWYYYSPSGIIIQFQHRKNTNQCDYRYLNTEAALDLHDGTMAVHIPGTAQAARWSFTYGMEDEITQALADLGVFPDGSR